MINRRPKSVCSKKKGFELQISFLVIVIISIVIFGSGLYLMKQFFKATSQFQAQIDSDTQREIERRLSESGEKVSLPINKKVMRVGEEQAFGLGILNTRTPDSKCPIGGQEKPCNRFGIAVRFITAVDSKTQKTVTDPDDPSNTAFAEQDVINNNWIPSAFPVIELTANQLKVVSIPVVVGNVMNKKSTPTRRGTIYIFNVCVKPLTPAMPEFRDPENCEIVPSSWVSTLHGQKVLKMYVEVQ